MEIDLKWGLPFALPFAFLGTIRAVAAVAGMDWHSEVDKAFVVVVSTFLGLTIGGGVAASMQAEGFRMAVRLRK